MFNNKKETLTWGNGLRVRMTLSATLAVVCTLIIVELIKPGKSKGESQTVFCNTLNAGDLERSRQRD